MASLQITALDAWTLREPVSRRTYTVVRLTAKSGLVGYGECVEAGAVDVDTTRRAVIGRPATSYETVRLALREAPALLPAINAAMLDLVGRWAGVPVFQILGGPTRHRVRALALLHGFTDDELAANAKALHAAGFRALAVPLPPVGARNQGQAFTQAVERRLEAVGAAVADADLVLDGSAALTPGDAGCLASALGRFRLLWFDEPCRLSNLAAVRKVSEQSATPLGFGRDIGQPGMVQDALREEILDVLRPDLARHGITQIRRLSALAETYYIAVAPRHDGGPIGTAVGLHLAAALPNFFIQQIPVTEAAADRHMRAELAGDSIESVAAGFASLPTGAGLGITVSEDALERYKERTL